MKTPRLVGMFILWLLAAGSVALSVAVVVTEVLVITGVVDRSGSGYGFSLSIMTGSIFVVLAVVPFVFRHRFVQNEDRDSRSV